MRQRPVFYALAVLALALLGAGVSGVVWLRRFVEGDPRLCSQCHQASPEFALWAGGSHKSVACQRCHHSTPEQGLAMLRAFLSGRTARGGVGHAPVEVGACAQCHLSHDQNWPQVGSSRGHRVHYQEHRIACITCHAAEVHGFRPLTEACRRCHGEHSVRLPGMAKLHCFACHDFLAPDPGLRPTRRDCLRCHQAKGVLPSRFSEDAPMQFACGTCHKPHARPEAALSPCSACHERMGAAGLHASPGHRDCAACHEPHLWRAKEEECLRCHLAAPRHAQGRGCSACHSFSAEKARTPRGG